MEPLSDAFDATETGDWYNAAVALRKEKRPTDALPLIEKVVEREPDALDARYVLANVLTNLERYEEAEPHFRRALELAPNDVNTLNKYGRMLRLAGRYSEALAILRRGAALAPDDPDLQYNISLILSDLRRHRRRRINR